jgi:hypothetical protein
MILPHATGHVFAPNGHLLRVDLIAGQWVASRISPDHVVVQQTIGSVEHVHQQVARWLAQPSH